MSEENSPAPLRLKPRLQPDAAPDASATTLPGKTAPAPSSPEPTAPSPAKTPDKGVTGDEPLSTREAAARVADASAEPLRFKLKPKLSPSDEPSKAPPIPASAPENAPSAAPEATDAARFKLKPKTATGSESKAPTSAPFAAPKFNAQASPTPMPATAPITTAQAAPGTPAATPTPAPAPMAPPAPAHSPAASAPTKVPFVQAPRGVSEAELIKRAKTEKSSGFKGGAVVVATLVVVLLGVGSVFAYGIYQKLSKSKHAAAAITTDVPKTPAASAAPAATPAPAPAASNGLKPGQIVVDNPTSDAGKLVAKARDTVAKHDSSGLVDGVNEVLDDSPANAAKAAKTAATTSAPTPAPATVAPAAVEETPPPPPAEEPPPEPSRGFRDFVVNMRVNGVFQGTPARALINGKMAHEGEIVDFRLAITLLQVDPQKKLLTFKDATGASMSRRY